MREVDLTKMASASGSHVLMSVNLNLRCSFSYRLFQPQSFHSQIRNPRTQLLKLALPLVQHHGFTRTTLARSVLDLPKPHTEPLSDSAVTTLFGEGDAARLTLIDAWLDEGLAHMRSVPVDGIKGVLLARLEYNVPVLEHLPEVSRIDHVPTI